MNGSSYKEGMKPDYGMTEDDQKYYKKRLEFMKRAAYGKIKVKDGKEIKEKKLARPFAVIEDLLCSKEITNICLISGLDNPADPLTKAERGVVSPLKSLMTEGRLRRISNFEWLKPKNS